MGKARSLRKRVRQYFAPRTSDTRFLVHQVRTRATKVETIATAGDMEALILENSLIKKLKPRFNVRLRDDKEYLCIRVDLHHRWPRMQLVRRPRADGARTFGPYHSARNARALKRFLTRHFMLRTCKESSFQRRTRPCLQHEIGRCLAPCTLDVDHDEYMANVRQVILYLEGRVDDLIRHLEKQMDGHAARLEYEQAAEIRDRLQAVKLAREKQRVVAVTSQDQDVLALARSAERVVLAVLFFRRGTLQGIREEKIAVTELADEQILSSFVGQYYAADHTVPDEILLPTTLSDAEELRCALEKVRGRRVRLHVPRRGRKKEMMDLARENACRLLERWDHVEDPSARRLERLQARLSLPSLPERIECVDISHTGGAQTVGSLAVMVDGVPQRSLYRRYRVKTVQDGDDYAAMREVLTRRFSRARGADAGWEPPDLMVVDGGRGQLRMAMEVMQDLGVEDVALAAIAKDRKRERAARVRHRVRAKLSGKEEADPADEEQGYDSVWLPGKKSGIAVRGAASPLALISHLRDEAHRFAVRYHRKLRSGATIRSELTQIHGVGPATTRKLLDAFGSVRGVREATADEIALKAHVGRALAERIREHLGKPPEGD